MTTRKRQTWLVGGLLALVLACCVCSAVYSAVRRGQTGPAETADTGTTRPVVRAPTRTIGPPTPTPAYTLRLADALAGGRVSARVQGKGLDAVTVVLERLVPESLEILIPVGTFFVNHAGHEQDMVAVYQATVHLTDREEATATVKSACANLYRSVPDEGSALDIEAAPPDEDLRRLVEAIERGPYTTHAVKQIAVWVVTNDVSRAALDSRYRSSTFGISLVSSPAASDEEVIRALWLVQDAGIPVQEKTLFAERVSLVRALASGDAEVREWASGCLDVRADGIVPYLCASLDEDVADLRQAAAVALGKLAAPDAVEPLTRRLQDPDEHVRAAAAEALGEIGDRRAVGPLTAALEAEEKSWVRSRIELALRRLE